MGARGLLVPPPAVPSSGSDQRCGWWGENEPYALHAQLRGLPGFAAQRRQAQEAMRQVLYHIQRHGLAQVAQSPREHDRVVQHGVQSARLERVGGGRVGGRGKHVDTDVEVDRDGEKEESGREWAEGTGGGVGKNRK